MNFDDTNNNDEFYWEREFRKDDARIQSCMHEIPAVIDLPEEDELLMKRLQKQPEYARNTQKIDEPGFEDFLDFEDILFPENWREREGASIYGRIEHLMKEWAGVYASQITEKDNTAGIRILCIYGKIMGFSIDLVDAGEEKMPGLKIALCKRIIAGINSIMAIINDIENLSVPEHAVSLKKLRHFVLNLRFKLNNEVDRN